MDPTHQGNETHIPDSDLSPETTADLILSDAEKDEPPPERLHKTRELVSFTTNVALRDETVSGLLDLLHERQLVKVCTDDHLPTISRKCTDHRGPERKPS